MNLPRLAAALLIALGAATGCRRSAEVTDLDGKVIEPIHRGAISVLIFLRTDCPISNKYAPELIRLHELFSPRGVQFYAVYPAPRETATSIAEHQKSYSLPTKALLDPQQTLVERTGAQVTPEAAVFARDGRMIYRGRIDDRFLDFGKARPAPTRHDLQLAIEAALTNVAVRSSTTAAVGCYLRDLK